MDISLVLIILASALLHATWNVIIKGAPNKLFETILNTSFSGVYGLAMLCFLPLPVPASWPYLLSSTALLTLYYFLLSQSYRKADLSYTYTMLRGSAPLFTAMVAVFLLHEALSPGGWAGVVLLSAGILTLALDSIRQKGFQLSATILTLGNALIIMGYTVVDGSGVRLAGNVISYVSWLFFLNSLPLLLYCLLRFGRAYVRYARQRWVYGLAGAVCNALSYGVAVWGMAIAPIPLVASLRECSVIFGMILAILFLGEKFSLTRLLAVLMVVSGVMCIKLLS